MQNRINQSGVLRQIDRELDDLDSELEDRRLQADAMKEVEQDIQGLASIMEDLQKLVHDQNEMVDSIEHHVEASVEHVEKGHEQLRKTVEAKSRNYPMYAGIVGTIVAGGPIGIAAGSVAGVSAAVAGAVAGVFSGIWFKKKVNKNNEAMVGIHPDVSGKRQMTTIETSIASFISGVTTRALIQPLDVLKIRFQLQEEPLKGKNNGKYKSIFQALRLIAKDEGYAAFWKGHVPAQYLSQIYAVVQFTLYGELYKALKKSNVFGENNKMAIDFVAGGLAGCVATTMAMPLDVIRTRMVAQGEPKIYPTFSRTFAIMYKNEKIGGFYKGLIPSLYHIVPFTGLQFLIYDFMGTLWNKNFHTHFTYGTAICGFGAGVSAKVILYPLDIIRHRLQIRAIDRKGFGKSSSHVGMIKTIQRTISNESVLGLYKGLSPSLLKAGATSGLAFYTYEFCCDAMRTHHKLA
uniref:t-SNARE coiled-coil homology domain-containing protein n=1 Tax=Rhabditophanes sp. KR3021 TaxID=114890 RepID=A0AC35TH00_9BILA